MQEFSSVSVSSYEAAALADRLSEQSADGWTVVSIVPTGSTITAYLCRPASDDTTAPDAVVDAPVLAPDTVDAAPAAAAAVVAAPEPTPEPAPAAAPAATTPVADAGAAATATTTATDAATPAVAAGWYADPSTRFELRYWDGSQWTEHVSRGGQQYTDPPVA